MLFYLLNELSFKGNVELLVYFVKILVIIFNFMITTFIKFNVGIKDEIKFNYFKDDNKCFCNIYIFRKV